jgi:hypothetical protein
MWRCSYECKGGVVIIHAESIRDKRETLDTFRDLCGGHGGGTWFETPRGFLDVESVTLDERGFVTAFGADGQTVQSDEHPCLCAMLTGLEHITAWLRLGGVTTEVGLA